MAILRLTIDGSGVSGNHYKMPAASSVHRGRQYVTSEAASFKALCFGIAMNAAFEIRWSIPEYVRVDVSVCNMRFDRDNAVKVLYDALQGVGYKADSRILDGGIRLVKDDAGPRYEVSIMAVDPALYGRSKKKNRPPVLSHDDWVAAQLCPF